jgi:SAM-dependent methyltransferase
LLSGVSIATGFLVLHRGCRKRSEDQASAGFRRTAGFILAGLLLIVVPMLLWIGPILGGHTAGAHAVSPAPILLVAAYLNAAFLWLIWNINACSSRSPQSTDEPWQELWGEAYSPELKRRILVPVLDRLEAENAIGNLVVDIGSGAAPVSQFLAGIPRRKFIHIDIAARNERSSHHQYLRLDADKIAHPDAMSHRKALGRICDFLGLDARRETRDERVSTMLFSDILNYVDYRKVIRGCVRFLRPGGRIIVVNLPTRGIREQFSERGLKANDALYPFLKELSFEIEWKEFPCRPPGATDEAEELIVLVARKRERVPSPQKRSPTISGRATAAEEFSLNIVL